MNTMLTRLRLAEPFLPTRPAQSMPPQQRLTVTLNAEGLAFLRRIIIQDYQKHLFGQVDRYCDDFTRAELQITCELLAQDSIQTLSGLEYRYLLDYVSQRMQMICKYDCSLLVGVGRAILFFALNTLRLQLEGAAQGPHSALRA